MRYVVLDLETTGLNRERALVLEVAALVLNDQLAIVGEFTRVLVDAVRHEDMTVFEEGAMNLHRSTGLFAEVAEGKGTTIEVATGDLIRFLADNGVDVEARGKSIMIGNNPEFDRAFLRRFFPAIESCFHYRMIDVSTLREVAALASGLQTERLKAAMSQGETGKHRALGDTKFCHRELVAYASCFNGAALVERLKQEGRIG